MKGQFDIVIDSITITDSFFGDASLNQTEPGGFANGTLKAKFVGGGASIGSVASGLRLEGVANMEISELVTTTVTDDNDTPNDTTDDTTTQISACWLLLRAAGRTQRYRWRPLLRQILP